MVCAQPADDLEVPTAPIVWHTSSTRQDLTGLPKGVRVTHRNIIRLVSAVDYVQLGADTRILHFASLAFDASTFEIWGCSAERRMRHRRAEPHAVFERARGDVARHIQSTLFWLTSSLFNTVVDERPEVLKDVRQLLIGGEALSVPHVVRALDALPETEIINGYGPTEATTFTRRLTALLAR